MQRGTPTEAADTPMRYGVRLNVSGWHKIREALGLDTDAKLARHLALPQATICRLMLGNVEPSPKFIAASMLKFPEAGFDRLFTVYRERAA